MPQETPSSEIPAEDLEEVNKEQELEEGDNDEVPIEAIQNYGSDDVPDGNEQFMMEDEGDVTNEVTRKFMKSMKKMILNPLPPTRRTVTRG